MLHIMRMTLLSALVAMSARAQRAEGPRSPVPMMTLDMGTVTHIDLDGSRVIADCRQQVEIPITGGPRRGQIDRKWEPCMLLSFVVHPPTGRWALATTVMRDTDFFRLRGYEVAGRELPLPRDRAGRVKGGNFLVLGDRDGVVAVTPGTPEMWTDDGTVRTQSPVVFTQDGSRVLVIAGNSSRIEWWSWSFGAWPEALRVLPPGVTDGKGNALVAGEHRTVLMHPRDGVRVATLDPMGTRPWKVGRRLGQVRRGLLTPLVLGDTTSARMGGCCWFARPPGSWCMMSSRRAPPQWQACKPATVRGCSPCRERGLGRVLRGCTEAARPAGAS